MSILFKLLILLGLAAAQAGKVANFHEKVAKVEFENHRQCLNYDNSVVKCALRNKRFHYDGNIGTMFYPIDACRDMYKRRK